MKKRHIIQLIFFIISVGLIFLYARQLLSSDIHEYCPYSIVCIGLNTLFAIFTPAMIIGCLILLSSLFFGRWFCSYVCYFGSLSEFIFFCIPGKKIKISTRANRVLQYVKYVVLLATLILSYFGFSYFIYFCPHYILANFSLIFGSVLCLILLISVFVNRLWCRFLCPFGAMQSVILKTKGIFTRNDS